MSVQTSCLSPGEVQVLSIFPPGRCRAMFCWLVEHMEEIDDTRRQHGQLAFNLYREGEQAAVSTSGVTWKAERCRDYSLRSEDDPRD